MRWCRTLPTRPCYAGGGRNCTRASRRCWSSISPILSGASPNCLPITSQTRPRRSGRLPSGSRPASLPYARSAHREAANHFGCALDLLGKLPSGERQDEQELELRLALSVPLIAAHGFGSPAGRGVRHPGKGTLGQAPRGPKADLSPNGSHGIPALCASRFRKLLLWQGFLSAWQIGKRNQAKFAIAHRALGYSLLIAGEFQEASEILDPRSSTRRRRS